VYLIPDREQSDSSVDEDDSDVQYETLTKVGSELPRCPFSGKPGLNVDLEDPDNLLHYFELLITPNLPN
jgi:hypothetical protein